VVFYLDWAQGFPRKNCMFIILLNFFFLLCQEQPVQKGSQAVCENFAKIVKTQFAPLLCFVLLNLTGGIRVGFSLKANTLRDPRR